MDNNARHIRRSPCEFGAEQHLCKRPSALAVWRAQLGAIGKNTRDPALANSMSGYLSIRFELVWAFSSDGASVQILYHVVMTTVNERVNEINESTIQGNWSIQNMENIFPSNQRDHSLSSTFVRRYSIPSYLRSMDTKVEGNIRWATISSDAPSLGPAFLAIGMTLSSMGVPQSLRSSTDYFGTKCWGQH